MIAMTFPIAELRDRNLSPFPMSSNGKYMICLLYTSDAADEL